MCIEHFLIRCSIESVNSLKAVWWKSASCCISFSWDQVHVFGLYYGQVGIFITIIAIVYHIQVFSPRTELCIVVKITLKIRWSGIPHTGVLIDVQSRLVTNVGSLYELPTVDVAISEASTRCLNIPLHCCCKIGPISPLPAWNILVTVYSFVCVR